MCNVCTKKLDYVADSLMNLLVQGYATQFNAPDDLKPQDYDLLGSIALVIAVDMYKEAYANPVDHMMKTLMKALLGGVADIPDISKTIH